MANVRVPVAGTIGKSVSFDPQAGARAEAAVEALARAIDEGIGSTVRHSSLLGLQTGDDHPQYTMWQAPETIKGLWNFQTIPLIQGDTLAEYIEDVVGGSFFDFLQDTTSVVWTYHETANELEANVPPEFVQDTIGAILQDTDGIDLAYNDLTPSITATLQFANPSGLVGMSAVNGSAGTPLRSDARHAIDPAIAPTWTGRHQWNTNGFTEPGIEVWRDDSVLQANITSTGYALQGGGTFHANFARGTRSSPSAAQAGDITGGIGSRVYDGSAFQGSSPASIHWQVTENTSGSAYGMWLRLLTTPKGTTTRQERGGVTDNGTFWSHDTGTYDAAVSAQTQPIADARFVASATIGSSTGASFTAAGYGSGITAGFRGATARGTAGSPTASQANDFLCFMGGHGYGATGFSAGTRALVGFKAQQNWTDSAQGAFITFEATPDGSTTRAEHARMTGAGNFGIGTTSPQKKFVVSNGGAEGFEVAPGDVADTVRYLTYDRIASAYQTARHEASVFEMYADGVEALHITSTTLSSAMAATWTGQHQFFAASGVPVRLLRQGLNGLGPAGITSMDTDAKTAGDSMLVVFRGNNSSISTHDQNYAFLGAEIVSPTAGSESGSFDFYTINAGAGPSKRVTIRPSGALGILDGITAPSALAGFALIYVDSADGDLKIIFADGTIKTIVTD